MFGIGWTELIVVALVLLIFVGPKHLPGMLKKFVEIIAELRSASREFRNQIEDEMGDIESPSKLVRDVGRDLIDDMPSPYAEAQKAEEAIKEPVEEEMRKIEAEVTEDVSDDEDRRGDET